LHRRHAQLPSAEPNARRQASRTTWVEMATTFPSSAHSIPWVAITLVCTSATCRATPANVTWRSSSASTAAFATSSSRYLFFFYYYVVNGLLFFFPFSLFLFFLPKKKRATLVSSSTTTTAMPTTPSVASTACASRARASVSSTRAPRSATGTRRFLFV